MKPNSHQLTLLRTFNAPISLVWDAWTDPNKTALWWGPRGFSITTIHKDLRPGGQWTYTMHGPDGVDYPNTTTYFVVEPLKKLEYDHGAHENQKPLFRVTVDFSEEQGITTMKMVMNCESAEAAQNISALIHKANGTSTWDRLAEYLDETHQNKHTFILNRSLEAPIDLVFEMFIHPAQIEQWQPPSGFKMKIINGNIEAGNSVFYEMSHHETKIHGRSTYQKIMRPELLSFYQEFCDANGATAKHPGAPVWPAKWLTSITFTKEDLCHTRVTLTSEIIDTHTTEELEVFLAARPGMTHGWNGSFDRLEIQLAAAMKSGH